MSRLYRSPVAMVATVVAGLYAAVWLLCRRVEELGGAVEELQTAHATHALGHARPQHPARAAAVASFITGAGAGRFDGRTCPSPGGCDSCISPEYCARFRVEGGLAAY